MSHRKVVVTGLGLVTPIGCGVDAFWQAALRGENGVRPLQNVDAPAGDTDDLLSDD